MALNEVEEAVLEQLEMLIRLGRTPDEAADQLRRTGISPEALEAAVDFRLVVARTNRLRTVGKAALDPEEVGSAWYSGVRTNDVFWPKLEEALLADPGWTHAVPSLDAASHDIVGLLHDPHSQRIATRGLVIGHVQSGKTANFTATIAKAADAGYRLFIVLSGVHNALRRQTQLRLERQLRDLQPKRWLELTDEHRDFGNPVKALALVAGTDLRLLAVVKKNAPRLRRLRDWLRAAESEGGFETCPILIIDDEADQASPNAARNPDLDRTAINKLLVEILELPRVAYVGYTATPFANVLIDPNPPADLYPRHFIYALPKPPDYFGAEELFGLGLTEDEDPGHDVIRIIPDTEAGEHRPSRGKSFTPELTNSLYDAIRWFLLATAARRARSGVAQHSSMLIHTTQLVAPQFGYLPLVKRAFKRFRDELGSDDSSLREVWRLETAREPATRHGLEPVSFDQLVEPLGDVLEEVRVVVDNGSSIDRLLYDDEAATTVVAIGGNTLSRGLTLEGLVSSFFLRGANAYDTLLQMGRWFGYRKGYGDLPRIWTTIDLVDSFRNLADVERSLREEVERYAAEQTSPIEVGVRIKLFPGMQVTSKVRMSYAVSATMSFSGQRPQTILFHHRDSTSVEGNLNAARTLVADAITAGVDVDSKAGRAVVLRGVPARAVLDFFANYRHHEGSEMSAASLGDYIRKQVEHGQLEQWNVAVMTRESEGAGAIDLGSGVRVNLFERSRLEGVSSDPLTANIGTLMSRPDRLVDEVDTATTTRMTVKEMVERRTESGRALLMVYPIAANSQPRQTANSQPQPKEGGNKREPLNALDHLIGMAVAFPTAPRETDPESTITVDMSRVTREVEQATLHPDEDSDFEYEDVEGDRNDVDLGGDA